MRLDTSERLRGDLGGPFARSYLSIMCGRFTQKSSPNQLGLGITNIVEGRQRAMRDGCDREKPTLTSHQRREAIATRENGAPSSQLPKLQCIPQYDFTTEQNNFDLIPHGQIAWITCCSPRIVNGFCSLGLALCWSDIRISLP